MTPDEHRAEAERLLADYRRATTPGCDCMAMGPDERAQFRLTLLAGQIHALLAAALPVETRAVSAEPQPGEIRVSPGRDKLAWHRPHPDYGRYPWIVMWAERDVVPCRAGDIAVAGWTVIGAPDPEIQEVRRIAEYAVGSEPGAVGLAALVSEIHESWNDTVDQVDQAEAAWREAQRRLDAGLRVIDEMISQLVTGPELEDARRVRAALIGAPGGDY